MVDKKKKPPQNKGKTGRGRGGSIPPIEYRWKPGQSGNPGGRPKRDMPAEIAQAVFEKHPKKIAEAMFKALLKGRAKVFKELADRGYGKVAETVIVPGIAELPELMIEAQKRANEKGGTN